MWAVLVTMFPCTWYLNQKNPVLLLLFFFSFNFQNQFFALLASIWSYGVKKPHTIFNRIQNKSIFVMRWKFKMMTQWFSETMPQSVDCEWNFVLGSLLRYVHAHSSVCDASTIYERIIQDSSFTNTQREKDEEKTAAGFICLVLPVSLSLSHSPSFHCCLLFFSGELSSQ